MQGRCRRAAHPGVLDEVEVATGSQKGLDLVQVDAGVEPPPRSGKSRAASRKCALL
jgi:hypothetical protein